MADTIKTAKQLELVAGFADGDDRMITIENPKNTITAENVKSLGTRDAVKMLLGDKTKAKFTGWKSAAVVETTVTTLDLETV